jgi:DNA-binding MarR family transcriptional regulator
VNHDLEDQAERLYDIFAELARAFQYRDREQICCYGVTISQCHALEMLQTRGPMTMSALAGALFLDASTVTRIADRLADDGLVVRGADPADRRVHRVRITDTGNRLVRQIRRNLVAEQRDVLQQVPAASREAVISALGRLLDAFRARQARSCACSDSTDMKEDAV